MNERPGPAPVLPCLVSISLLVGCFSWWRGEDSNLRRHSQQIYSLPRLTASVPLRCPGRRAAPRSARADTDARRPVAPCSPPSANVTRARARHATKLALSMSVNPDRAARSTVPTRDPSTALVDCVRPPQCVTRAIARSWRWDSNPQPADYKSAALPVELRQRGDGRRGTIEGSAPTGNGSGCASRRETPPADLVEEDRARRRDVERCDPPQHGDSHPMIESLEHPAADALAFRAEDEDARPA